MSPRWTNGALALLAVVAVVFAYAPVHTAAFIWDDDAHVTANAAMHGLPGLKGIWTSAKANYSPLTMTSFWVQHAIWGLSPMPFHWVTVLFHAGCACILWRVLVRLNVPGAWLGAMLWALHPVQVESVAWISELKNTQSGFFYLLSIWFFVRWLAAHPPGRVTGDYFLSLTCAVLGVLSKSSTVMLPVVLLMIGWWRGRRDWREVGWLAPFFAVSLLASAWTIWEQKVNSMASGPEWSHGLLERGLIAGKVIWFYLGKLLWPEPLVFIYPRWNPQALGALAGVAVAAAAVAAWLAWRGREGRGRPVSLVFGYFVVSLFPVLGFFDVFFFRYSFVGDHFQYLASMGPLALLGAALAWAIRPERWRLAAGLLLLLALGLRTHSQARIYQSNLTLWQDTAMRNPEAWIARVNYGQQLEARGQLQEALGHYDVAVRMKPQFTEVEVNYGNAVLLLGRAAEAMPHFERAIQGGRGVPQAHNGMGLSLAALGRFQEAIAHYEKALELQPDYETARFNLGNAYYSLRRHADALAAWRTVVAKSPPFVAVHTNIGAVLLELGQPHEALAALDTALRLDPNLVDARCNVALALLTVGRASEALPHIELALRLRPDFQPARDIHAQIQAALAERRGNP